MNKIALVTGGNSGIGYATAKLLNDNGFDVYILGRDKSRVEKSASELNVKHIIADLSDFPQIEKVASNFKESGLDVLVNNAGISQFIPLKMYSNEIYDEHFNINLKAKIFLLHALISPLEKRQGCVINISSILTKRAASGFSLYIATKGALEAFTRSIAIELAPKKIRVNAICPGFIDTPIYDKFGMTEKQITMSKASSLALIPMKRLGKPDEIAQVVLSQIESTYVTGAIWNVDGGVDT